MQSSGSWASVPSLPHQHSDESSSGNNAFSLISVNSDSSEISHLDLDVIWNMAIQPDNSQSDSANILPVRPAVADWVQEQSLQDQPSNAVTGPQREQVDGTPSRVSQAGQARIDTDGHASRQEDCQPARKVYDIPTLLRLKETQSTVPVMLRVKPEAIAGESMTLLLPRASSDWLIHCLREHLPVHGSCNVTSAINTFSGPFRHLQYLYGKSKFL